MKPFRFPASPIRIYEGADCFSMLGAELDRIGSKRAILLCGRTLASTQSMLDPICAAMGPRLASILPVVKSNTPLSSVELGVDECNRRNVDAVVVLGGGSAMTTARAICISHGERQEVGRLKTSRDESGRLFSPKLLASKLPILSIPTTATSAIVKAGSAVLDPTTGERWSLYDPKTRAQVVFINPLLLESTPDKLAISAALSSMTLAFQGLMSLTGNAFSDAYLMHAVRLFAESLPLLQSYDKSKAQLRLVAASILTGQGTDHTGAGIGLPLSHALSAKYSIDHGVIDSVLLPHVVQFNACEAALGIQQISSALAGIGLSVDGSALSLVNAVRSISASLGLPARLRDVGIERKSLSTVAGIAFGDWFLQTNPRPVRDATELQTLLEAAW